MKNCNKMKITDISESSLNDRQAANLRRFIKKLPRGVEHIEIHDLPNGGKAFQADVRAKNISGSFARYEKRTDAWGKTVLYTKTTYAPDGSIMHVKSKFPPGPAFYPGD